MTSYKEQKRLSYLQDFLPVEDISVLEIGVGDGTFSQGLRSFFPNITTLSGFDINPLAEDIKHLDSYIVADSLSSVRDTLTKDTTYDYIIIAYSLHHFPSDESIADLLTFLSDKQSKIIIIEEILTSSKRNRRINVLTDIISNFLRYGLSIGTINEYFSLRFKSDTQRKEIFSDAYTASDGKRSRRYGFLLTKSYLLEGKM